MKINEKTVRVTEKGTVNGIALIDTQDEWVPNPFTEEEEKEIEEGKKLLSELKFN